MPRVISHTPSWLSRPSPGFDLFAPKPAKGKPANGDDSSDAPAGARKTIARRGTEIFIVVGNEIRWSDLLLLQEQGSSLNGRRARAGRRTADKSDVENEDEELDGEPYRVLRLSSASGQIIQLVMSPQEDYMAIVTSHTIHIAILPNPSHLASRDTGPLKLKTFHLGPTTHVLEQSPLASVLWHPLGVRGRCLVTVTTDAVVRLWEINRDDRWSCDKPALAFDMKKLANAISNEDDLQASAYGTSKGFSPDSVEMEVAAACFGGSGLRGEHSWAAMTLWVAMKGGDVYALCPLLPSKWQPSPTLLSSLALTIAAKGAASGNDKSTNTAGSQICDMQKQWFADIDSQAPLIVTGISGFERFEVYSRPAWPGPIPKLQGPFQLDPEPDDDAELTDILVMGLNDENPRPNDDEYEYLENDDNNVDEGLPLAAICLLTNTGKVQVCLNLNGIEAQWLSSGRSRKSLPVDEQLPGLLVSETVNLSSGKDTSIFEAAFTPDVNSRYSFFVTHESGVFYVSLSSWLQRLADELTEAEDAGSAFRVDLFLDGTQALVEKIVQFPKDQLGLHDREPTVSTAVVLQDSDLGYFLLTSLNNQPLAVTLDAPDHDLPASHFIDHPYEPDLKALPTAEPRLPYQPPQAFWETSALTSFIESAVPTRHKRLLKDEVKLSPATLELLTEAHRVLSHETHRLGVAAAELFRRCERLQDEFRDQRKRAAELVARVEAVTGEDEEDVDGSQGGDGDGDGEGGEKVVGKARVERRLERVRERQRRLMERHGSLRRKLAWAGGRELSDREAAWVREVEKVAEAVGEAGDGEEEERHGLPWQRYGEVKRLKEELVAQAQEVGDGEGQQPAADGSIRVPAEFRKAKVEQVMGLLDRESALVDTATEKLRRLGLGRV